MGYNTFTTLDVSGAIRTEALGIAENGLVVGFYVDTSSIGNIDHGFSYNGSTFTTIDDPSADTTVPNTPGNLGTVVTSLNDQGHLVGYYFDNSGVANGFLDSKGVFTTIDDPAGTNGTFVQDISENRQIVGYYIDGGNVHHGFVYNGSSFTSIDDPSADTTLPNTPGNLGTVVTGVNNPGQLVGYYYDNSGVAHAFLDDKGTFTTLADQGSKGTFAEGIDETGRIVGYYVDSNNVDHGFVYAGGTFTTVDDVLGSNGTGTVIRQSNDPGQLVGYYAGANGIQHGFLASPDIVAFDTETDQNVAANDQTYTGPVNGLQRQYLYSATDNVNITVSDDNWFLHGGPGDDALQAHGGYNVLDGGTGSNFLTGGSGTDTFFVDDRGPSSDIWSTMNAFHRGDDATVFGITSAANIQWFDNQGASGFTGLTMHVFASGHPTASLTLPGYASSDLGNGRLAVQFGTESDGTPFMHILAS